MSKFTFWETLFRVSGFHDKCWRVAWGLRGKHQVSLFLRSTQIILMQICWEILPTELPRRRHRSSACFLREEKMGGGQIWRSEDIGLATWRREAAPRALTDERENCGYRATLDWLLTSVTTLTCCYTVEGGGLNVDLSLFLETIMMSALLLVSLMWKWTQGRQKRGWWP